MRIGNVAKLLLVLVVLAGAGVAQTSNGILAGVVHDPSGAIVSQVSVTGINQDTGETRSAVTRSDGTYHVDAISPGLYTINAEAPGFEVV